MKRIEVLFKKTLDNLLAEGLLEQDSYEESVKMDDEESMKIYEILVKTVVEDCIDICDNVRKEAEMDSSVVEEQKYLNGRHNGITLCIAKMDSLYNLARYYTL